MTMTWELLFAIVALSVAGAAVLGYVRSRRPGGG
jgi:hypothetical protein